VPLQLSNEEKQETKPTCQIISEWPEALRTYKNKMQVDTIVNLPAPPPLISADKVFEYTDSVTDWEEAVDSIAYVEKAKLPGLVVYIKWYVRAGVKSCCFYYSH
jgi:hypothetical protein